MWSNEACTWLTTASQTAGRGALTRSSQHKGRSWFYQPTSDAVSLQATAHPASPGVMTLPSKAGSWRSAMAEAPSGPSSAAISRRTCSGRGRQRDTTGGARAVGRDTCLVSRTLQCKLHSPRPVLTVRLQAMMPVGRHAPIKQPCTSAPAPRCLLSAAPGGRHRSGGRAAKHGVLGDIATAARVQQRIDEQADSTWRLHEVCMLRMSTFSHNTCNGKHGCNCLHQAPCVPVPRHLLVHLGCGCHSIHGQQQQAGGPGRRGRGRQGRM